MRKMQNVFDIRINKKAKFSPSAELSAPEQVSAEIDSATF